MDNVNLNKEDSPDQYQLPTCFLKRNLFEGGSSLSVHQAESLHLEGMEAATTSKVLAEDSAAMIQVLEKVVMYSEVDPH